MRQPGERTMRISLAELLSTCIGAAQLGCEEIRRVQHSLSRTDGSVQSALVDGKIAGNPRSALTAADLAAQMAIVGALQTAWPGLRIIGEEDDSCNTDGASNADVNDADGSVCDSDLIDSSGSDSGGMQRLRRDLCSDLHGASEASDAALDDIVVFVDPLDGTREFVEGRVWNVQTLIGISLNGHAIAGAIGLPFAGGGSDSAAAVVYALVGAGPPQVHGERAQPQDGSTTAALGGSRPRLVRGDAADLALDAAYATALSTGGQDSLLGGTGQKCLAVAEGRADLAVMNFQSSSWDTCASEAVVRAAGGDLTDIFGERLLYSAQPPYLNACGAVASSAVFGGTHRAVCAAMRQNVHALERLKEWGLVDDGGSADAAEVERVLRERRELLRKEGESK